MSDNYRSFTLGRRHKRNMIIGITLSALIVLICLLYYSTAQNSDHTLQLVHMVFRHGDRTPTETYPNDPYKNYDWPGGWGALTNKGKLQLYQMGQTLHARYKSIIENHFTVNKITVKSSDSDRCHMSAGTLLAGLFPPSTDEIWNNDLLWQPIPIRALPRNQDNLIAMKKKCKTYDDDLKNAYNSEEIKQINNANSEMYTYLTKHSGQDISNITSVEFLFNTLEIEEQNGLALPSWVMTYYPNKMKVLAARSLSIFTETQRMRRLKGGVIVKEMIEHIQKELIENIKDKRPNDLKKKMFLYSAHDISLTNIIRTLGFIEDMKPEYGATLLLEAHSSNHNDFEIKLLYYNNTWTDTPHILKMNDCGEPCLFENFVKTLRDVIPVDWEKECLQV